MTSKTLNSPRFYPYPHIKPTGWLARQLRIQADGLSGHLDEFWPDVKESRWFGGEAEGWERAPYWLDGVVPLAFLLDDEALKAKVTRYVDYILTHQQEDGWLGPREMAGTGGFGPTARYDLWAMFLLLKVLVQYYEFTPDDRVVDAVSRCLHRIDIYIERTPLFNWGQFRWFEALIAIYWLYDKTEEQWLLDLAVKLRAQGFDWRAFFERWPLTTPTPRKRWTYMGHVVNNAMALKSSALWWRLSGDAEDYQAVYTMLEQLDQYHGMVTGVFTGDECLAGLSPIQGTELCAVVEYAYSLEVLLSLMGDSAFGDRLERITFNALPATFSPDMWAHQYDQQVNQVECSIKEGRPWNTNGPEANIFGLEPNYGCCTANFSQGWPKFATHLWMQTDDGGLAAVAYAPSVVKWERDGVPITVSLKTEYPFKDTLRFEIQTEHPVTFPLLLRVPAWATGATLEQTKGKRQPIEAGAFYRVEQIWQGTNELVLTLPMQPRLVPRPNRTVVLERGPLVYALKIGEEWHQVNQDRPHRERPHADWEVYPTTPWNYALAVNEATLAEAVTFVESSLGEAPFSPEGAPVRAIVKGARVPQWQLDNGSASAPPPTPMEPLADLESLTLIPYGCTNLRITEFPVVRRDT